MSKASTRKRNRITLALGAFSMLTFGGMYGMIAHNAALDSTTTAAVAEVTAQEQTTALVLTDPTNATAAPAPTVVATAARNKFGTYRSAYNGPLHPDDNAHHHEGLLG